MKKLLQIIVILLPFAASAQIWETINFDTGIAGVRIDTSISTNIWQIGRPQKPYFDSAFTLPNAIVTDTINSYPTNNLSAFNITLPNVRYYGVNLYFQYKIDTDSLMDGGKIEVSYDNVNWINLINSTAAYFQFGLYTSTDSISSMSDNGYSGHSNGWQSAWAYWNYPPADTMYLQFIFTSDSNQTNKDGWMIDSIFIRTDLGIGIKEIETTRLFQVYPNPARGLLHLCLPAGFGEATSLTFISSCGQQIKMKIKSSYVDLKNLNTGMYLIVATNQYGEVVLSRVLKE